MHAGPVYHSYFFEGPLYHCIVVPLTSHQHQFYSAMRVLRGYFDDQICLSWPN